MKTEIKMLVLEMHPIDKESIFEEGKFEEQPSYELQIPVEEIVSFMTEINSNNYKLIRVKEIKSVNVYTEDELDELKDKLDTCYDKFESIYDAVDNIGSCMRDIESELSDIEDESIDGQDECKHD